MFFCVGQCLLYVVLNTSLRSVPKKFWPGLQYLKACRIPSCFNLLLFKSKSVPVSHLDLFPSDWHPSPWSALSARLRTVKLHKWIVVVALSFGTEISESMAQSKVIFTFWKRNISDHESRLSIAVRNFYRAGTWSKAFVACSVLRRLHHEAWPSLRVWFLSHFLVQLLSHSSCTCVVN